jgi:hypothetical protein
LEILHRATVSSYNRSAADLQRSRMRHLLLEERRFPVVAPLPSPSEGDAQEEEEEEEEEQELQPMQVSFSCYNCFSLPVQQIDPEIVYITLSNCPSFPYR